MNLLLIIAIIIVLVAEYNENKKANQRKIVRYDTQTGQPIYEGDVIIGYNTQTGNPIYGQAIAKQTKENKPLTEEDKTKISNTILMITGACLVVFASIIFLISSWNSVPNIVKTFILIFIQVMFILFSYICNNKLNIPKVAKVFKVLSFIFVPIVLISLSTFNIVPEEFCIEGEYFTLYIGASFIISDIIFKLYGIFKNDMSIKKTSYFMELLGVIFITEQLFDKASLGLLIISAYNIIMYILLQGGFLDNKAYKTFNDITSFILVGLLVLSTFGSTDRIYNVTLLFYTVLFFFEYFINKEELQKKKYLVLFFITYFVSITAIKSFNISPYFLYLIALIPIVVLAKYASSDSIKDLTTTLITIFIVGITVFGLDSVDKSIPCLMMFVFSCIDCILSFILLKKNYFKIGAYITFTLMICEIFNILEIIDYIKYILLFIIPMIYLLEATFENLKDKSSEVVIIGGLALSSYLLCNNYAILIVLALTYLYTKLENKSDEWLLFPIIFSIGILTIEDEILHTIVGLILMVTYTLLSVSHEKITSHTIVSLLFIIIGSLILGIDFYYFFIITLAWSLVHLLINNFVYKVEKNELFKIVGILSLLGLYIRILVDFEVEYYSLLMLGLYISLIAITKLALKKTSTELTILEWVLFLLISFSALYLIGDMTDSLILITIMFILIIGSFIMKYKSYLYCSIISLVGFIIHATWEFWTKLPWYVYILIIGLALILFAMFDEKLKQKK